MSQLKGKLICTLCAMFVLVSVVVTGTSTAKADTPIMHKISTATANAPINYNFTINRKSDLKFAIKLSDRSTTTINIKETGHDIPTATISLASTDPKWQYRSGNGIYEYKTNLNLNAGDYILELRFENDTNYDMTVTQKDATAKLNKNKITITKGFADSISVKNGKIKKCSSSNKAVAVVTNKGKITAKKNGSATIKVTLTNKKVLSCKVKVVSNQYSAKKITVDNSVYNIKDMKVYQASFDKKGNLQIKFQLVNNSTGKIVNIKNLKVVAKNKKTYASYTVKNYKVSVDSFKDRSYTVTIPKSKLKMPQKKIDLRTSKISITGKMVSDTM